MHYWKRKLPFGKILGETFVRRVLVLGETGCYAEIGANLIIPKIHIVVPYLKVDPNQVDQRDVVTEVGLGTVIQKGKDANTLVLWSAQAIISLTATRSKPPVSAALCEER